MNWLIPFAVVLGLSISAVIKSAKSEVPAKSTTWSVNIPLEKLNKCPKGFTLFYPVARISTYWETHAQSVLYEWSCVNSKESETRVYKEEIGSTK